MATVMDRLIDHETLEHVKANTDSDLDSKFELGGKIVVDFVRGKFNFKKNL